MSEITNFSTFDTAHKFQKDDFVKLNQTGIFELSIFLLYVLGKIPEYNTVTNLMMLNTHNAFMRICEYFGGQTITIPTIQEVKDALKIIQMYNQIDIQEKPYSQVVLELAATPEDIIGYNKLKLMLEICGVNINETNKKSKTK